MRNLSLVDTTILPSAAIKNPAQMKDQEVEIQISSNNSSYLMEISNQYNYRIVYVALV